MDKSYIWLEEKNELINDFSIGYMINPNLSIKKSFKDQVTKCKKTTFGAMIQQLISKIVLKKNKSVSIIYVLWDQTKKPKKNFKVLSCVIYTIIRNYVYIDYLGSESKKLSELGLGSGGSFKHVNKSYDKISGIRIPYMLMNLMSCRGFLKNTDSVAILKCPKGMFEYYSSKVFIHFYFNKRN